MHPRIVLAIARRDLVDAAKNMYLIFAIVLPIAMSLLFRVLFPSDSGSGGGVLDIAIYDAGQSQLVQYLVDSKQFSMFFVGSAGEVRDMVSKDKLGGLVIPANFDADVADKKMPELPVYFNTSRGGIRQSAFYQLVEGGVRHTAGQSLPAKIVFMDISEASTGKGSAAFNLSSFYLLLFLVMSLTMVGVFVVPYILVEEKEKNTLKAVLVSPATYSDVVVGKALVGLFYALLVALTLMLLNNGFTGNVLVTTLGLVLGSVFLVQVGLLMGAAFKTVAQVNSWSSIVMLALMLPGMFGDFLPPPEPIPTIMKLIPTTYLAKAVTQGMADTATLTSTAINLGVLTLASAAAFAGIIWFLKRERQ